MAPSLELCFCPKCNDALVSHRTVLCHAAADHTNQPIPTFNEWIAAAPTGKQLDGVSDDEDGYEGLGMEGIEDKQEQHLNWTDHPLDVCTGDCHVW